MWGAKQETLEEQALKALDIFSEEHNKSDLQNEKLEEGEISETQISENSKTVPSSSLDIDHYIKTQEALQKRQAYKKSLACTDVSKEIAKKISEKLGKPSKRRRKDVDTSTKRKRNNFDIISPVEDVIETNKSTLNNNNSDIMFPLTHDKSEESQDPNESGSEYIPSEHEFGKIKIFKQMLIIHMTRSIKYILIHIFLKVM